MATLVVLVAVAALVPVASARAAVIATYGFPVSGSGENFDIPANDSTDTEPDTTAARLVSSGVDGGGAGSIINNNDARFNGVSNTPPRVCNWGNAGGADLGNYVSFRVTPDVGFSVTYDSISLFHHSFNGTGQFSLRYIDDPDGGGTLQTVVTGVSNPGTTNAAPLFHSTDFGDFTSSSVTEWRIYIFAANDNNTGFRLDDITLNGTVIPEPATLGLVSLGGLLAWRRRR